MKRATTELRARACRANAFFLPAMWLTLFLPAWTLDYWQAWLYWLIYAVGTVIGTRYFLRRDPALIERQLRIAPGNANAWSASAPIIAATPSLAILVRTDANLPL